MWVTTPHGKQGKWWNEIPDRENTENFKILGKIQGIWKIFDRKVKSRKYAQKKLLRDIDGFIFDASNVVILLRKYTGKAKITLGNHRENTGNFALQLGEWEPCNWA